jgi:sporulation protein YlmC with PRC-barrel domain
VTRRGTELRKAHLIALDGEIGHVSDIYFDDSTWLVRYFVVDTRKWLPGRKVLIAPHAVDRERSEPGRLAVNLTKEQIRNAPGIEEDRPVSQQHQADLAAYYAWPLPYEGMAPITAGLPATPLPELIPPQPEEEQGDPHLRSMSEVKGYHVTGPGGQEVGTIEDIELNDRLDAVGLRMSTETGETRSLAPENVAGMDWATQTVTLRHS